MNLKYYLRKYKKVYGSIAGIILLIHFLKLAGLLLFEDLIVLKIGATEWNWAVKISIVIIMALVIFHEDNNFYRGKK